MSWGRIYCTTNWGYPMAIGYSMPIPPNPTCIFDDTVGAYYARVTADSGTEEAHYCIRDIIETLRGNRT